MNKIIDESAIDLSKVLKAQAVFERFRQDMRNDRDQAGAVQAFEFCYELAWKIMKRFLAGRGQETGSPKDTFRAAAIEKIIDDPEIWFEFQKKRVLASYTYDQENLETIVEIFDQFSLELEKLVKRLKDFEESDLSFKVDVVDWNMSDEGFRAKITPDLTLIQEGKKL